MTICALEVAVMTDPIVPDPEGVAPATIVEAASAAPIVEATPAASEASVDASTPAAPPSSSPGPYVPPPYPGQYQSGYGRQGQSFFSRQEIAAIAVFALLIALVVVGTGIVVISRSGGVAAVTGPGSSQTTAAGSTPSAQTLAPSQMSNAPKLTVVPTLATATPTPTPTPTLTPPPVVPTAPPPVVTEPPAPDPTPLAEGSVTFSPSSIPCGAAVTVTIVLPSWVGGGDEVQWQYGDSVLDFEIVSDVFTEQADGSWIVVHQIDAGSWSCTEYRSEPEPYLEETTPGTYTLEITSPDYAEDAAAGSYTVVDPGA
jgi:hypothetical protein